MGGRADVHPGAARRDQVAHPGGQHAEVNIVGSARERGERLELAGQERRCALLDRGRDALHPLGALAGGQHVVAQADGKPQRHQGDGGHDDDVADVGPGQTERLAAGGKGEPRHSSSSSKGASLLREAPGHEHAHRGESPSVDPGSLLLGRTHPARAESTQRPLRRQTPRVRRGCLSPTWARTSARRAPARRRPGRARRRRRRPDH